MALQKDTCRAKAHILSSLSELCRSITLVYPADTLYSSPLFQSKIPFVPLHQHGTADRSTLQERVHDVYSSNHSTWLWKCLRLHMTSLGMSWWTHSDSTQIEMAAHPEDRGCGALGNVEWSCAPAAHLPVQWMAHTLSDHLQARLAGPCVTLASFHYDSRCISEVLTSQLTSIPADHTFIRALFVNHLLLPNGGIRYALEGNQQAHL